MKTTLTPPLIKTLTVPIPPDRAFDLFTRRMAEWWPLHSHAVSSFACRAPARGVVVPQTLGEMVIETLADGTTAAWGRVTAYQPPALFAMTWHPGSPEVQATHVEIRFAPEGEGTRLTLTHSGWQNRPDGAEARANYDSGWNRVLNQDFDAMARQQTV